MEIFGQAWLDAWRAEINQDPVYADKGARWSGPVMLRVWPAGDRSRTRAVWLDLDDGRCHAARPAGPDDRGTAALVIGAPLENWARVLGGEFDPVAGLMAGKLKLEKGNILKVLPFADGARAMLAAATRVGGELPDLASDGAPGADPSAETGGSAEAGGTATADGSANGRSADADGTASAGGREPSPAVAPARGFRTTRAEGLRHDSFPMRLWHKAKKLGAWDPRDVDFSRDAADWARLEADEQDILLRLTTLFQAGEEAVAVELLPLIDAVASQGHLEEEMYLTSFLYEEAKHVEVFRRFLDEVAEIDRDLSAFLTPAYVEIFERELPAAMGALRSDRSAIALARAAVTYNMIVEGVLAETGYHAYVTVLDRRGILPGTREAVTLVKRDESRHIAYGLYLLSRLGAEGGDAVWSTIDERMEALLEPALQVVRDVFDAYEVMPFDLELADFLDFGLDQFRHRVSRLATARREGGFVTDTSV